MRPYRLKVLTRNGPSVGLPYLVDSEAGPAIPPWTPEGKPLTGPNDLDFYVLGAALLVSAVLFMAAVPYDGSASLLALVARGLVSGGLLVAALLSVKHGLHLGRSEAKVGNRIAETAFGRSTDAGRWRKAA